MNMLYPALLALIVILPLSAYSADEEVIQAGETSSLVNKEILRQKVKAEKRELVANNMNLTDVESKRFWPIYDSYQKDLQRINDRISNLIYEYAEAYNNGSVLDKMAKKLLDESVSIEQSELDLKKLYISKLSKILPSLKVVRYIQIETKARAIVKYQASSEIPLVD